MNQVTDIVRELRKKSTPAEKIFWEKVKAHRFLGLKFKRQEPIFFDYDNTKCFFVADFICLNNKTVIEIDGRIHDHQKDHDLIRDDILNKLGYRVIRIKNEEIIKDAEIVLDKIKGIMENMTLPRLRP